MKTLILAVVALVSLVSVVMAEYVQGYYRSDGTYVSGYYRADNNNTVQDNYSYKNNYNPYTGKEGNNYYKKSPSSEYYSNDLFSK